METENNYIGNITTIVKYVSMLIAGWFIGLLVAHGINLPIEITGLSEVISSIIFLLLAHVDATNPNTIFNNAKNGNITDMNQQSQCEEDNEQ